MGISRRFPTLEEQIGDLAARQHGLVTRAQLLEAGLSGGAIDGRVKSRRLRPIHRGVYRVGAVMPPLAGAMAAVLACGPSAVISHATAGWLWRILVRVPEGSAVDVTVPGKDRGRRPGIRAHRVGVLSPEDVAMIEGIPVTSAARTLIDLAAVAGSRGTELALARARRLELVTGRSLTAALDRSGVRRGVARIRRLLEREGGPALTRSEAERRLLALIRRAGLPVPEANVVVAGFELDFFWPGLGIAVEVDGFRFHKSRGSFESDRRRDLDLAAAGVHVIRITWRQVVDDEAATLVRLVRALDRAAAR